MKTSEQDFRKTENSLNQRKSKKQRVSISVISKGSIPDFHKDNPNPKGKRMKVQKGNVM